MPELRADNALATGVLAALGHHLGRRLKLTDDLVVLDGAFGPGAFACSISAAEPLGDRWNGPLVLRVATGSAQPATDAISREGGALSFVAANGFSAPEPLSVITDADNPVGRAILVTTRPPGRSMLELITENPMIAGSQLEPLAAHQAQLHRLPAAPHAPFDNDDFDLATRVRSELADHLAQFDDATYGREETWLHINRPEPGARVLCHGDFQPSHALVDGEANDRFTIANWAGAGLGDAEYDVAATLNMFWCAPFYARKRTERMGLKLARDWLAGMYTESYTAHAPLDAERLQYWQAFQSLLVSLRISAFHRARAKGDTVDADPALFPADLGTALRGRFRDLTRS
jgi:aminoglycoside phosphotransferase (APT) family kinase protein